MIKIKNITKHFGGIKAVDNVSIEIKPGKITAFIGPNGSGKSTLFNLVSGLIKKDLGDIYISENKISKRKEFDIAKEGISRTFQDVRLFKNLTIREHIEIAKSEDDEKLFYNLVKKEEKISVNEVLNLVGLKKSENTLASELSYGQRKLLDLAIAIELPHKILTLDEPVAGVNPELRKQIKKVIKELKDRRETILLIEHDMNFVMDLADEIFVLDEGKIIAQGRPKQIQNNKKVLEAYLGE